MLIMLDSNNKGHYYCISALYISLLQCMDTLYHLHNFSINLKLFRRTDKVGRAGGHRALLSTETY